MAQTSFIFGGDGMPKTPQELARMRAMAEALAPRRTPQNVGEGIASIGNALAMRLMMGRADRAEKAGIDSANSAFDSLFSAPEPVTSSDTSTTVPMTETAPVASTVQPVEGTLQNARTADRNSVQSYAGMDLKSGIKSAADALGISAEDLATAISYETAGTFDPMKKGPRTQWGQHKGLIQFGEPQAEKYGVDWENPLTSQLGPDGAVVKYLRDAGVKPGMGLLDVYSAINAGGVNRYDATDENNGGAKGTVRDKVNTQMDGHRQKALALFADDVAGEDPFASQPSLTTTPTEQVPVVPVPEGFQQPDPLQTSQVEAARVQVADNSGYFPPAPRKDVLKALQRRKIDPDAAYNVLSNEWLPKNRRAMLESLLKRQTDEEMLRLKQELEQADPLYQQNLRKGEIELKNLESPPMVRRMTNQEEIDAGLDTTGVYDVKPDNSIVTVQQPKDVPGRSRVLTKEEKAAMGLPLDAAYQVDERTNKVSAIGGGNTNIRVDTGTIPAGYKANRDENGNIISIEPLPGSTQAQDAAAAKNKADLNKKQLALKSDIVSQDIDRAISALEAEGLPSTGWGSLLSGMPGTNAKALDGLLKTVKANVSFDTLNQMRQASPTGGALGSVTEKELSMLQSTLGNLEQSQDDETIRDNLNRVWNVYQDIVHGPGNGPERRKLSFMEKPPAKQPIVIDGFTIEPLEE